MARRRKSKSNYKKVPLVPGPGQWFGGEDDVEAQAAIADSGKTQTGFFELPDTINPSNMDELREFVRAMLETLSPDSQTAGDARRRMAEIHESGVQFEDEVDEAETSRDEENGRNQPPQ